MRPPLPSVLVSIGWMSTKKFIFGENKDYVFCFLSSRLQKNFFFSFYQRNVRRRREFLSYRLIVYIEPAQFFLAHRGGHNTPVEQVGAG
jgi:hypothetical protein